MEQQFIIYELRRMGYINAIDPLIKHKAFFMISCCVLAILNNALFSIAEKKKFLFKDTYEYIHLLINLITIPSILTLYLLDNYTLTLGFVCMYVAGFPIILCVIYCFIKDIITIIKTKVLQVLVKNNIR